MDFPRNWVARVGGTAAGWDIPRLQAQKHGIDTPKQVASEAQMATGNVPRGGPIWVAALISTPMVT